MVETLRFLVVLCLSLVAACGRTPDAVQTADRVFVNAAVYTVNADRSWAEAVAVSDGESDNRHHFTHLQLIHENDIPRFGQLNVGATFQSMWAYPDPAAIELDIPMLGEERTWQMYPIGSINRTGGRVNGASDYFVTSMNPLLAIEVAITRQDPYSNEGPILNEDERVDLATMIDAYTINGAYTMSLEDKQGSIEVGKRADLVVLDRNLFETPSSEISEASVTMTVFDGRTVYQKPE